MRLMSLITSGIALLMALASLPSHAMTLYLSEEEDEGQAYIIANDAMLKAEDAAKIQRFLNTQASKGIPTAIFITSPGGFGELMAMYARAIVEPSNELYRRHKLFNIVVVNEECSSACVILMGNMTTTRDPKALKIMVAPDAKFGFHSPVDVKNGAVTNIRDQAEREARIRIQIDLLAKAGVSSDWLTKNENLLRGAKMTFLSGQKLCMDEANIVPNDSCVQGVADLGTLARNQLSSAIVLAQAGRRGGNAPVRTAKNPETIIADRMSSRPASAPKTEAVKTKKVSPPQSRK